MSALRLATVTLCTTIAGSLHAEGNAGGLRFDSPSVLDLAGRTQEIIHARAVPVNTLDAADAKTILAAPTLDETRPALPFSYDIHACKPPSRRCSLEHERALIVAEGGAVKRKGRHLTIAPSTGAPAQFVDWSVATTTTADGDETTHGYLGRLPGSGYHRVEVQFGHDAPGSFLINPSNGNAAFVHNGADVVVPSTDGLRLVTFNSMNPPLSLRVADLDATGPRLALTCAANQGSSATLQFKGWHDVQRFDLALVPASTTGDEIIALRLVRDAQGWSVATPDPQRIAALAFSCRQRSP